MTFEEVMSNEDSENETDDDALDLEERLVIFIYFLDFRLNCYEKTTYTPKAIY